MDGNQSLKESHPEKFLMKYLCRNLYYLGCGDYWYEETYRSNFERRLYNAWVIISNTYLFSFIANECLAHLRNDLTLKERNDLLQFTCAHPSISLKFIILYMRRDQVKCIFKRMLEGTRSIFISPDLDKASMKRAILYCIMLTATTYITLFLTQLEAVIAYFVEGIPIRSEVTLFPKSTDTISAKILRFFIEVHWWFFVTIMIQVDCLCYCSLVYTSFRFKLLQQYFEGLGKIFINNPGRKTRSQLEEEYQEAFIVGVSLHDDVLSCASKVQDTLGAIYSVQILESLSLIVMCLIKLVHADRNFIFLLADLAYIAVMMVLTGVYMTVSGDITHEAAELSTSIFHCGWELSRNNDMRPLIVLAIQRSQVPVYMTGLGVIKLSYANFISILRSSYSFFAVMY
ncbi:olfactory receptor 17 [Aphomia sociella]